MCVGAKPTVRCYRYMCVRRMQCVCKKMIGYNIVCVRRAMGWVMKQSILDDEESCRARGCHAV